MQLRIRCCLDQCVARGICEQFRGGVDLVWLQHLCKVAVEYFSQQRLRAMTCSPPSQPPQWPHLDGKLHTILHRSPHSVFLHVPEARFGGEAGNEHILLNMTLAHNSATKLAYRNRVFATCNTLHSYPLNKVTVQKTEVVQKGFRGGKNASKSHYSFNERCLLEGDAVAIWKTCPFLAEWLQMR